MQKGQHMTTSITILIVDDHRMVRQSIHAFLNAQPDLHVVGEAESGEKAIQLAHDWRPDVVLMDLMMPGMNGIEATRAVMHVSPQTRVVVLTSSQEDGYILPALQA